MLLNRLKAKESYQKAKELLQKSATGDSEKLEYLDEINQYIDDYLKEL